MAELWITSLFCKAFEMNDGSHLRENAVYLWRPEQTRMKAQKYQ